MTKKNKSKEIEEEKTACRVCDYQLYNYIEQCAEFICSHGLEFKGILRISGNNHKIVEMQEEFYTGKSPLAKAGPEHIHAVVGVMKSLIKSLDKPLLSDWRQLLGISRMRGAYARLFTLRDFLNNLPAEKLSCLASVFNLLVNISERNAINSMTADNIAKVLTPTLCGNMSDTMAVRRLGLLHKMTEELITFGRFFFKNGLLDENKVLEEVSRSLAERKSHNAPKLPWPQDNRNVVNTLPGLSVNASSGRAVCLIGFRKTVSWLSVNASSECAANYASLPHKDPVFERMHATCTIPRST